MPKQPRERVPWESGRDAKPVDGSADSSEFFYINKQGFKDDTELHGRIIRERDYPIDEKIMGPIRQKYREAHKAKRKK